MELLDLFAGLNVTFPESEDFKDNVNLSENEENAISEIPSMVTKETKQHVDSLSTLQSPNISPTDFLYGASGVAMGDIYGLSGREMTPVSIAGTNHLRVDGKNLYMLIEKVNDKISKNRLPGMVMKSLLYITCMYVDQHSRLLSIKLSDLVSCLGFSTEATPTKSQIDRTRREFLNSLEYLYHMSIHFSVADFSTKKKRDVRENYEIRLFSSKWGDFPVDDNEKNKFVNGVINIRLTEDFEEILSHSPLFLVPKQLLALSVNNIYVLPLGIYLARLHSIKKNHSTDPRKDKSRCVKVLSILKAIGLPDINEVRAAGDSWTRRIKEVLERSLDALTQGEKPFIKYWHYGRPLTDGEDLPNNPPEESCDFTSFEDWCNALIWIEPYIKYTRSDNDKLTIATGA